MFSDRYRQPEIGFRQLVAFGGLFEDVDWDTRTEHLCW